MPLYEYECDACGRRFERIQKFSDPPIETCPTCEGRVRKLLSSPAIQFKGSGWYITDYKKSGGGGHSGSGDKGDKGGGSSEGSTKAASEKGDAPAEKSSTEKPATSSTPTKTD
jgi:putative FmdB family regulatory protein